MEIRQTVCQRSQQIFLLLGTATLSALSPQRDLFFVVSSTARAASASLAFPPQRLVLDLRFFRIESSGAEDVAPGTGIPGDGVPDDVTGTDTSAGAA